MGNENKFRIFDELQTSEKIKQILDEVYIKYDIINSEYIVKILIPSGYSVKKRAEKVTYTPDNKHCMFPEDVLTANGLNIDREKFNNCVKDNLKELLLTKTDSTNEELTDENEKTKKLFNEWKLMIKRREEIDIEDTKLYDLTEFFFGLPKPLRGVADKIIFYYLKTPQERINELNRSVFESGYSEHMQTANKNKEKFDSNKEKCSELVRQFPTQSKEQQKSNKYDIEIYNCGLEKITGSHEMSSKEIKEYEISLRNYYQLKNDFHYTICDAVDSNIFRSDGRPNNYTMNLKSNSKYIMTKQGGVNKREFFETEMEEPLLIHGVDNNFFSIIIKLELDDGITTYIIFYITGDTINHKNIKMSVEQRQVTGGAKRKTKRRKF